MEVLGVLILAQVGEDATRAVFGQNLCGDPPDDGEQFEQKSVVVLAEGEERRDVAFGDDDDVRRVEGARVVEGDSGQTTMLFAVTPTNANEPVITTPATTTTPDDFVPPPDATKFENSNAKLDGKLAEHYLDFSFYYPNGWEADPRAGVAGATNFVKVERRLPPDFTQENFAVGWYTSQGTYESDTPLFPRLVELLSANLSKGFPEYRKVSEGPTKINSMDAYEFRFMSLSKETSKGDIQVWGRVVFLPSGVAGQTTGATLIMLATSLAPELAGVEDVGDKGQMPVILDSFRFENKQ